MTPTTHKKAMKVWAEDMRELRGEVRKARVLRTSGRFVDQEDAQGILDMAGHTRKRLQARLRYLKDCEIVKYGHVSPNAADRLRRRRGE